jgi:hypothetical protein
MKQFPFSLRLVMGLLRIAAVLALILMSARMVLNQFQSVQAYRTRLAGQQDPATAWEDRLRAVRDALPPSGSVGYISEQNIPGLKYNPIDSDEEFAMTQYFLVPRILVRGSVLDYSVGNLNLKGDSQIDLKMVFGVQRVTSYGLGIYLFQRVNP